MKNITMIRVQSYFPRQLLEELKWVAEENKTSLAEIIRTAAQNLVEKFSKARTNKNGASILLKSTPKISFSGPLNLASKIDKYLYE